VKALGRVTTGLKDCEVRFRRFSGDGPSGVVVVGRTVELELLELAAKDMLLPALYAEAYNARKVELEGLDAE